MTVKNPLEARDAVTHYEVEEVFSYKNKSFSLVRVTLETGRTHQIRVHMANIGHPVLGDKTYGVELENIWAQKYLGLARQFLHAWKLHFCLDGDDYDFTAELKPDLQQALNILRD